MPRSAVSWLVLLVLAGCADLPPQQPISASDQDWVLAGAGTLQQSGDSPLEDPAELMHVSEEMRAFAIDATQNASDSVSKTTALAAALSSGKGLHLQYDAEATVSAEQAFKQRRANCLSYTLLFVALAREVGVPAEFNDVDIPPIWGMGDETTSLLYRHINARVDLAMPTFQIVDVSGDEYDPSYPQGPISDDQALAQFFNNRAVEMRLQKRGQDALRYQLRALQLAPQAEYLWTNLANLYLQNGNLRAARIAVTRAMELDSFSMLSYQSAEHIYDQLGEHGLALDFQRRAEYFLDQNPYRHYQLALAALNRNDNQVAYDETRRAIQLYRRDSRFFFLMAVALDRLDQIGLSLESMQLAIELAQDPAQQDRYRSKFARLTKPG